MSLELGVNDIFAISCGQRIIILVDGSHDKKLDQAGGLHGMAVDIAPNVICNVSHIEGPGSVSGIQKIKDPGSNLIEVCLRRVGKDPPLLPAV